jgi:hypothetical protein
VSEEYEMKRLGITPVKNSGRSKGVAKGDGILEPFLVDVKEYDQSFSVSRSNWGKMCSDAITNGRREPMFILALQGDEGQTPVRVWVISDAMGQEMLSAWREING